MNMDNYDIEKAEVAYKNLLTANSQNFNHKGVIKENFIKCIDYRYEKSRRFFQNDEIIKNSNMVIKEKWEKIQDEYPNLVFPKLKKQHHVCATRYNDNLVLMENVQPKLRIHTDSDVNKSKSFFEQLINTNAENLFAISVIPIDNIVSYQLIGDVEHVAIVSGGGGYGGKPSLSGAAIGGLLFGDAGAIIGAQTGFCIDPIESTIKEFDSRVTMLNLKNAEGQVEIRELPYYYSELFMKVIPEKDFNYLQAIKNAETTVQSQNASALNMVEEMKQLKELLDLNLISQEEYDLKRQQILKL